MPFDLQHLTQTHQMPLARVFGIVEDQAPLGPAQNALLRVPDHMRVSVQCLASCRRVLLLVHHLAEQVVTVELPDLPVALETSLQRHVFSQLIQRVVVRLGTVVQLHHPRAPGLTGRQAGRRLK